jgi:hypothetical protein
LLTSQSSGSLATATPYSCASPDRIRDLPTCMLDCRRSAPAAFLPILTHVADRKDWIFSTLRQSVKGVDQRSVQAIGRALRDDGRGDAPQADKKRAMSKPQGVALITPESIEAMLTRRPGDAKRPFRRRRSSFTPGGHVSRMDCHPSGRASLASNRDGGFLIPKIALHTPEPKLLVHTSGSGGPTQ